MPITLQPITSRNWRATLELSVTPEQLRFVSAYQPIAAIVLAKAYVRSGGLLWEPYAILAATEYVGLLAFAYAPTTTEQYWIYHFFIDQRWQGHGYGRAALLALISLVRVQHPSCQAIHLTVHPENQLAQRFYHHVGFRPTNQRQGEELVYRLELARS